MSSSGAFRSVAHRLAPTRTVAFFFLVYAGLVSAAPSASARQASISKAVGTIKAVSTNTLTLTPDSGPELSVVVRESTKLILVAPGQTNLKDAVPIQLADLHPGDRVLVRGDLGPDGKSLLAASVIAMAKSEIAAKQARERDEWQRHGISGLVLSSDSAAGNILIALPSLTEKKSVTVHVAKATVLRRYAPDSVRFDDAKPAPFDQIKAGDQLRARGSRTPDGLDFNADEIVTGAFRNIAATVILVDAAAGKLTVADLTAKKPVTLNVTADSQIRRLPPPLAQRIAARLKGTADSGATAANGSTPAPQQTGGVPRTAHEAASPNANASAAPGASRAGGGDLQQMISRMPAASLADLQKGDALMIVTTEGSSTIGPSIVTLLAGVEPILQASPSSSASILSPWSLGAQGEPSAP
jgi:hypothetical protein